MHSEQEQISALKQLNDDLENYFSNTIIPQLFVDAELRLRKFTPPAMRQFNLKEEYIGKPLEQIKENFRHPTIIENIKVVIATGKILEKEIQTTDMRWYQMNILPYHVRKENRSNGVIITFVDITERILDLKEQEKLIAEHELLLDTITHDIKNPILALGLTIELIERIPANDPNGLKSQISNLKTAVRDIKRVVEGLSADRWSPQRYQASEELLDLQNIIEDVRLAIAPQVVQTGAKIIQNLQISEFTFVRRKLRSVLFNLLNNAIKYTPNGKMPKILISTMEKDGYTVISVADNGIGIEAEQQSKIFEKFGRLSHSTEGSGVGLYLVNTIVTSSGGKITIESELGVGTTFHIHLPINGINKTR